MRNKKEREIHVKADKKYTYRTFSAATVDNICPTFEYFDVRPKPSDESTGLYTFLSVEYSTLNNYNQQMYVNTNKLF